MKTHLVGDIGERLRMAFHETRLQHGQPKVGAQEKEDPHGRQALQGVLQICVEAVTKVVRSEACEASDAPPCMESERNKHEE
jgi:hypothetical protein